MKSSVSWNEIKINNKQKNSLNKYIKERIILLVVQRIIQKTNLIFLNFFKITKHRENAY